MRKTSLRAMRRPSSRTILAMTALIAASALAGCRLGISDEASVRLNTPAKRHPIGFTSRTERLVVEVPTPGARLDRGQRADVHRFLADYKKQATERLHIGAPSGARSHMAVRDALADVRDVMEESGLDPNLVRLERSRRYAGRPHRLELSFRKPVATAPHCPNWTEDLGRDREVGHYPDFGCATQRNFANIVAHSRDLRVPQAPTPGSNQRRATTWRKYKGEAITEPVKADQVKKQ